MAKLTIAGDALVITSSLPLATIDKIKKYRKDALILKGGEDGKEPIFGICTTDEKHANVNESGISFAKATADGKACVTVMLDYNGGDVTGYVADKFGAIFNNLNKLEETLPAVVEEIERDRAAIIDSITVA